MTAAAPSPAAPSPAAPSPTAASPGPAVPAPGRSVGRELERGFRLVLLLVITASGAFRLLAAHRQGLHLGAVELVYLVVAVCVLAGTAVGTVGRRDDVPRPLLGLVAVALALDAAQAVHLTTGSGTDLVGGTQDWTLANAGWLCFFTLVAVRRRWLALALVAPLLVRGVLLVATDDVDRLRLVGSLGVALVVLQLGAAMFLDALRTQAARAERARDERLRLESDRALADALQADFRTRTQALVDTTVPLLRELADGTAAPGDERTRHRARIEGARLRRLFAEADAVDGSLAAEVRSVVEQVERAGVDARLECAVSPTLPAPARRALLEEPMATLALARTRARVVVQAVGGEVVVSVTTDGPPPPAQPGRRPVADVATRVEHVGGTTWAQSTWRAAP